MPTPGLSGAIDVIVIRQPDGTLKSTPFHVRYAAMKCLRAKEKVASPYICILLLYASLERDAPP